MPLNARIPKFIVGPANAFPVFGKDQVSTRKFFGFSLTPGHAVLVTISISMAVLFALRAYHIGEPADASSYALWIAQSWYYANLFFLGDHPSDPLGIGISAHPVRGLATFLGHMVSAFSVTDVFTYRSSIQPSYVTAAFYWILFAFGFYGIFRSHRALGCLLSKSETLSLLVLFAGLLFVGTVTLIGFSAPEVRFAAIPIATLSAAGVRQLTTAADRSSLSPTALVLCFLVAAGLVAISSFLEQLGSTDLPFQWLAVDLAKLQCFHFAVPGSEQ